MQKRAAIARAIVLNPKYLFCDEPNSGLDPKTSLLIDRLILEITHEYNITTIINTHDKNSEKEIGDNIVNINKVSTLRKESEGYFLDLDNEAIPALPVTKTYTDIVLSYFTDVQPLLDPID